MKCRICGLGEKWGELVKITDSSWGHAGCIVTLIRVAEKGRLV